jgi:hypothetical protein
MVPRQGPISCPNRKVPPGVTAPRSSRFVLDPANRNPEHCKPRLVRYTRGTVTFTYTANVYSKLRLLDRRFIGSRPMPQRLPSRSLAAVVHRLPGHGRTAIPATPATRRRCGYGFLQGPSLRPDLASLRSYPGPKLAVEAGTGCRADGRHASGGPVMRVRLAGGWISVTC